MEKQFVAGSSKEVVDVGGFFPSSLLDLWLSALRLLIICAVNGPSHPSLVLLCGSQQVDAVFVSSRELKGVRCRQHLSVLVSVLCLTWVEGTVDAFVR